VYASASSCLCWVLEVTLQCMAASCDCSIGGYGRSFTCASACVLLSWHVYFACRYGNAMNVKRTVRGYAAAGFAGELIEVYSLGYVDALCLPGGLYTDRQCGTATTAASKKRLSVC
jgi:hypothetical protein